MQKRGHIFKICRRASGRLRGHPMLTNAPTIKTKNLVLRGPQKSDLAPFTNWAATSDRLEHLGGNTDADGAWRGFIAGIGHWQWHGYGFFIVTTANEDTALGRIGVLNHSDWPEPELAYHLFDGAEGRNIAYESAIAVRHWAGATLGLGPLISMIHPKNTRSITLAKRLGATQESQISHDGEPALVYRHLAHTNPMAVAQFEEVHP